MTRFNSPREFTGCFFVAENQPIVYGTHHIHVLSRELKPRPWPLEKGEATEEGQAGVEKGIKTSK
jgi:hypothetical protein